MHCVRAARETRIRRSAKHEEASPKKPNENEIADILEFMCHGDNASGMWLRRLELGTGKGKYLDVQQAAAEAPDRCDMDCVTIGLACGWALDEIDVELGEALWAGVLDKDALVHRMCHGDLTSHLKGNCLARVPLREETVGDGGEKADL